MIYFDDFDEIVTMESTYGKLSLIKQNLIIPFINIGFSRHPLNESDNIKYLNYSYVVCENVVFIKKNNKLIYENDGINFKTYSFVYLSGSNLYKPDGVNEITILCENKYLQTLEYSELNHQFWEIKNLNQDIKESFLNFETLPNLDMKRIII